MYLREVKQQFIRHNACLNSAAVYSRPVFIVHFITVIWPSCIVHLKLKFITTKNV